MSVLSESQYTRQISTIQQELAKMQASSRVVTTPEELETLEHEIHHLTNRLAAAILGQTLQRSLDSDENQKSEQKMVKEHPQRLRSEGKKICQNSDRVRR